MIRTHIWYVNKVPFRQVVLFILSQVNVAPLSLCLLCPVCCAHLFPSEFGAAGSLLSDPGWPGLCSISITKLVHLWLICCDALLPLSPTSFSQLGGQTKKQVQGFLSAPPRFLVRDIVGGFMWTPVFHRYCWFHHLRISPILIALIGLDLFLIFFVTAAGRAAALLMNFVGLIFDSILTDKAC